MLSPRPPHIKNFVGNRTLVALVLDDFVIRTCERTGAINLLGDAPHLVC